MHIIFRKNFLKEIWISVCLSHLPEELVRDWPQLPHQPLDMATEHKGGAKMLQNLTIYQSHYHSLDNSLFLSPNILKPQTFQRPAVFN